MRDLPVAKPKPDYRPLEPAFSASYHSVVPTHVGVYRAHRRAAPGGRRCPHARGGVPSPTSMKHHCRCVVPTHVGVYRAHSRRSGRSSGCPHARGGVPRAGVSWRPLFTLSPRTWGCTGVAEHVADALEVVPTHVGVYRHESVTSASRASCPHARGGVPREEFSDFISSQLSPRTWGCTATQRMAVAIGNVVPTHVGVYRRYSNGIDPHSALSPRSWGCTDRPDKLIEALPVVPTHVGVYRPARGRESSRRGCPHARGGGPQKAAAQQEISLSPRTWGCTGLAEMFHD
jgi:hypothetical protein